MNTALLVIDPQRIYTDPNSEMACSDARPTIQRINLLIECFRERDDPIYLIRHVHKKDGSDLGRMFDYLGEPEEDFNFKEETEEVEYDDELHRHPNVREIVKNRYSAFEGTALLESLRAAAVERVVICGFMTNFCCDSTARSAHDKDFFVDFIPDATGTPGTENLNEDELRRIVGECMEEGIARVLTTEEYLAAGSRG